MQSEESYEIRVRVRTLAEASRVIGLMDGAGYRDVEMVSFRGSVFGGSPVVANFAEALKGHLNRIIVKAMFRLGAVNRESGVEVHKIVEEMKRDSASGEFVRLAPEGILTRTVSMVSAAILADRHEWLSYSPQQTPRRFWLTEKGVEVAQQEY